MVTHAADDIDNNKINNDEDYYYKQNNRLWLEHDCKTSVRERASERWLRMTERANMRVNQ